MPRHASLLILGMVAGVAGAGCSNSKPKTCFVGDPSLPPEMMIVHRNVNGKIEDTTGPLPMIVPPQGGMVVFVGPKVRNMDGCGVFVTASLRDECNNGILGLEQKNLTLEPAGDGWLQPQHPIDISNFSNLPTCPSAAAERRIDGELYLLKLRVEDQKGRMAEAMVHVIPYCAEPEAAERCRCQCVPRPELGAPCGANTDSGVPPGTCPTRGDAGIDAGAIDSGR